MAVLAACELRLSRQCACLQVNEIVEPTDFSKTMPIRMDISLGSIPSFDGFDERPKSHSIQMYVEP